MYKKRGGNGKPKVYFFQATNLIWLENLREFPVLNQQGDKD
jgi:hypothetical protein